MIRALRLVIVFVAVLAAVKVPAQPFYLPTANRHLFTRGEEEKFFVGTTGKPWTSGMFGCVRSSGNQMHEGLDIKCLERDKRGEPTDSVLASADGTVAYANRRSSLSNYGNYLVLRHEIDGIEVYTLYAHLKEIRSDLKTGEPVRAGERIGTLGRSTNTREGISRDRAHVHFEMNLFLSEHFADWYKKHHPKERNDHGLWNGQNLSGIDPRLVLLAEARQGKDFNLATFLRSHTELCRVVVRDPGLPFARRYPALVERSAAAAKEAIAGYEIHLTYTGLPFRLIARSASELKSRSKFQLLAVNAEEQAQHPCRKLVTRRSGRWELAPNGVSLLELISQ